MSGRSLEQCPSSIRGTMNLDVDHREVLIVVIRLSMRCHWWSDCSVLCFLGVMIEAEMRRGRCWLRQGKEREGPECDLKRTSMLQEMHALTQEVDSNVGSTVFIVIASRMNFQTRSTYAKKPGRCRASQIYMESDPAADHFRDKLNTKRGDRLLD